MKKILSFLLAVALLLSLCSCAPVSHTEAGTNPPDSLSQPTMQASATTAPAETEPQSTQAPAPSETAPTLPPQTEPPVTQPPATQPPVTEPVTTAPTTEPATEPPLTEPPLTEPPLTEPPTTVAPTTAPPATEPPTTEPEPALDPNGTYTTKEDVSLFIYLYGRLPNNFITKSQAEDMYGTTKVGKYGKCIGGDRFYNREGLLPSGYTYYECDIGTLYSSSRGTKRLVFTYSGIVYYTSDHYRSFTRLY